MKKKPPKIDRQKADKELSDLLRSPAMQTAFEMQQRQRELEAEEEASEAAFADAEKEAAKLRQPVPPTIRGRYDPVRVSHKKAAARKPHTPKP